MIGELNRNDPSVTVVGAGISGLMSAYVLDRAGYEVQLIEGTPRVGGVIKTYSSGYGLSEAAANSILVTPEFQAMCADIGVELCTVSEDAKARYIYESHRLCKWPLSVGQSLRLAWRVATKRASAVAVDEQSTLQDWAEFHFGRPVVQKLLEPFTLGIYGARPEDLCIGAVFPKMLVPHGRSFLSHAGTMRKSNRKAGKRKAVMMAPRHGMQALCEGLQMHLKKKLGSRLLLGETVSELPAQGNVLLAVPAKAASKILKSVDAPLAELLVGLKHTSLISITIHLRKSAFPVAKEPKGVGFLVAHGEDLKILGVLFSSSSFQGRAAHDFVTLTVMMGGQKYPEHLSYTDDHLREIVAQDLKKVFGIREEPVESVIHRWTDTIPCYDVKVLRLLQWKGKGWFAQKGRILASNYSGSIGIRGMFDDALSLVSET